MHNLAQSAGFFYACNLGVTMSLDKATIAIATGTGTTVGVSAAKSAQSAQSLLNSSLSQILAGDYTLYGSDIATIAGIVMGALGIVVTLYRIRVTKRLANAL